MASGTTLAAGAAVAACRTALSRPLALRECVRLPEHCVWEITNACNLDCVHCESASGEPRPGELTTAEALALCDALKGIGCHAVNLSGGEPFLRPDWEPIAARLVQLGMKPIMVSNLTCLTAAHLAAMRRLGITTVATSLDGTPEIHDRIRRTRSAAFSPYARTTAAIRQLKVQGFTVAVITHVSRWNLGALDAILAALQELRVDQWQVQVGLPEGRLREVAADYLITPGQLLDLCAFCARARQTAALRLDVADNIGYFGPEEPVLRGYGGAAGFWKGCLAGYRAIAIGADGSVRGCPSLDIPVGSIREESLADIWNDEKRFWFNACWDETKLAGACRACPYRCLCRGGCKSMALATTGSIYRTLYCVNQLLHLGGDPDRREDHGRLLP